MFAWDHYGNTRLWDSTTGKELQRFQMWTNRFSAWKADVTPTPDGTQVLAASNNYRFILWDVATGKSPWNAAKGETARVTFSTDGKQVLICGEKVARLLDAQTGKERRQVRLSSGELSSAAFSMDGKQLATADRNGTIRLWNAETGSEGLNFCMLSLYRFSPVARVAFSPCGMRAFTMSRSSACLWDAATGKRLWERREDFSFDDYSRGRACFSPDGKTILTGDGTGKLLLWNAATGREHGLPIFAGHSGMILHGAFSSDGARIVTHGSDRTVRTWDAKTGKMLSSFRWPPFVLIDSLAFSPEGNWVLTGSVDGTAHLWDARTGKRLCTLLTFSNGAWAVVDPEGRYDASNAGDVGLHWVIDNEPVALSQLKERYFEPYLLAKRLGLDKGPLLDVSALAAPKLSPRVRLTGPAPGGLTFEIDLANRGGGIGRVVVLVNGKERTGDARPRGVRDARANHLKVQLDLSADAASSRAK